MNKSEHETCQKGNYCLRVCSQHPVMREIDLKTPIPMILVIFRRNRRQILTDSACLPSFSRASAPKIL
ncbi:MAG TPA: hypothetical protein DDW21_07110 [Verrucomicrobiales bacterium]|nr:MAG: hypothetical protein B9S37_08410 [Verrucomicrobiae bacterium Tous-C3TDCM]PAZ04829.1 MAG: hypothetical protein CAK88_10340 [Verrucomicrobiae bacterium AMD-G2]HBE23199.1 hypothetical protein [Verrucomicrobiales bacterium]